MSGISNTYAQVIRIDNGISMSSFYAGPENMVSYSVFGGINYWQHKWFSLSSEIGYLRQGGKFKYSEPFISEDNVKTWDHKNGYEKYDYLQANTTFRLNTPTYPFYFYVGVGPRLNFLLSSDKIDSTPIESISVLRKVAIGAKTELGWNCEMKDRKWVVGMNASYDFGNDLKPDGQNFDTFRIMISIGYSIK